jgi:hypothetical protein
MKELTKNDLTLEWAELKQILRTHWVLSVCSIVFVVSALTEIIVEQFSLGPWPRLDALVGNLMDRSFIGSSMTWLCNAAAHTPGETYEFSRMPTIAHIMFCFGLAIAAIAVLLWWSYVILWINRKPRLGGHHLGIS